MEDPWESPWATSGASDIPAPTYLTTTKHDDERKPTDEGFSSPKSGAWGDEWTAEPWTKTVDSAAISLGDHATKVDVSGEDGWSRGPAYEYSQPDEEPIWKRTGDDSRDATKQEKEEEEDVWATAQNAQVTIHKTKSEVVEEDTTAIRNIIHAKQDVKGSSKVQELVGMYNDMARERAAKQQNGREMDEPTQEPEPMPDMGTDESGDTASASETTASEDQEQDDTEPNDAKPTPQDPGVLSYPIDMSKLDDLFPSTKAASRSKAIVADTPPKDAFTTISQRKIWYRISRYGSMRQHDMGEGYTRTTWANSEVRQKTIQIVRRWMEQDSIAGRVVLGGKAGAVGASLFNWDSSEPTVEIGELLRQRRDVKHTKGHSISMRDFNSDTAPVPSSVPATPTVNSTPMPISPWEEDTPDAPPSPARPPPMFSIGQTLEVADEKPGVRQGLGPVPSPIIPPAPFSSLQPSKQVEDDEDDDDWGEMMSSPTVGQTDTFTTFDETLSSPKQDNKIEQASLPQGQDDWGEMASVTPSNVVEEHVDALDKTATEPIETQPTPKQEPSELKLTIADTNDSGWGFGDWASPTVGTKSNPLDKSMPTTLDAKQDVVASPEMADSPGWAFGDVGFFDSAPPPTNAQNTTTTMVDEDIDDQSMAAMLQSLPDLTYMLK